jgi:hypothetical protein
MITAALLALALAKVSVATWGDPWEAAAHRELDRAITPQPNNEHLMRLSALRAFQDQRLEPLLISLSTNDDPSLQIHALLGLAELNPEGRLDPARIVAADPIARDATITLGLAASRLDVGDIRHLLANADLSAGTRLRLLTALIEQGATVDPATVAAIDTSDDAVVQARKAALRSHLGFSAPLQALAERGRRQSDDPRVQDACFEAIDQLRRLPCDQGLDFARSCIEADLPVGVRQYAMLMLLEQDAKGVGPLFSDEFERATRRRHQLDLALLLLMTRTPAPPRTLAAFGDDELLGPIGHASLHLDQNPAEALPHLETLIATGHRRTTSWILDSAADWPDSMAVPLLERILDQAVLAGLRSTASANGVEAASALLERAPHSFRKRLSEAEDDGPEQQLLLLALLQQPAPDLLHVVASIRRIGIGPADVLTLLVLARDSDAIEATDVANLKLVAASTTSSHAIRTQAAWLAVRHTGVVDDMVAALLRPAP